MEIISLKLVEMVNGEEVILGIIRAPDAYRRAEVQIEKYREEGRVVQVLPYEGKPREHY